MVRQTSSPIPLSSLTSILKFSDISYRCKQDDTVTFIQTEDKQTQHFSIEAFSFLGDHQFVFMHCRVKICNATDPQSRCAQGCLQQRRKRSLWTNLGRDEEYSVSHGPFMRKDEEEQVRDVQDSTDDLLKKDIKGKPLIIAVYNLLGPPVISPCTCNQQDGTLGYKLVSSLCSKCVEMNSNSDSNSIQ